jgi:hypothetical protein
MRACRCDNLQDCSRGEDEEECKFCNYDEFKCLSDEKCISEKWLCDEFEGAINFNHCEIIETKCVRAQSIKSTINFADCDDGSDEANCGDEDVENEDGGGDDSHIFYDDIKDYGDQIPIDHHSDSDGDKIVSTGDNVVPIFINPNSTNSESHLNSSGMFDFWARPLDHYLISSCNLRR